MKLKNNKPLVYLITLTLHFLVLTTAGILFQRQLTEYVLAIFAVSGIMLLFFIYYMYGRKRR